MNQFLVVVMDNGYIANAFQCKTLDDAEDLAVSIMQDMDFDSKKDDLVIFRSVLRQSTYDLVMRWQDIYPKWEKKDG